MQAGRIAGLLAERLDIVVVSRSRLAATTPTISGIRLRNSLAVGMVAGAAQVSDVLVALPGDFEDLRVALTSEVSRVAELTVKVAEAG